MMGNAWGELSVQILSNALIGGITGYGVVDQGGADLDISTIPLSIASYVENDFYYPDRSPEEAGIHGLKYTGANFLLGTVGNMAKAPSWAGSLGTEFTPEDGLVALISASIGYGADKLEEYLGNERIKTIEKRMATSNSGNNKKIVAEK